MTSKLITALAVLALAAFGLAACGDDDETTTDAATTEETTTTEAEEAGGGSGGSGGGGGTIEVAADPNGDLSYTTGSLSVDSGSVEIEFDNPSSVPHDVRVEGPDGEELGGTNVISSDSESVTLDLEPGEYTYYCSVGGHRQAGMEETLTVE